MTATLFVELAGRFSASAMERALRALGEYLGTDARGALVIKQAQDRMDPREPEFTRFEFWLTAPRGTARWDGPEWASRTTIWLTLKDLSEFGACREILVRAYDGGSGMVEDSTDRPEQAAHNAQVFAREGRVEDALAICARVLPTAPQQHEGRARSVLEGIRLHHGGVGPDGAWLKSTLARDPGNLEAWRLRGGPEAERAIALLTPYSVDALVAGRAPDPASDGDWRALVRGGVELTDGATVLWNQLLKEAGTTAWDVRTHAQAGGPEGVEPRGGLVVPTPEAGKFTIQHRALWFGAGLRTWVEVAVRTGRRVLRVHWLGDQEYDRRAVLRQRTLLPVGSTRLDRGASRAVLLPNAGRWANLLEDAKLEQA